MKKNVETTLVNDFTDYLKMEKGLSENSVNAYESDLKLFFNWIKSKEIETDKIKKENIISYLEYMQDSYSRFSILRKITAIRVFYLFCFKEKEITKNPAENLEKMKKGSYLPEVLTMEEIKCITASYSNEYKDKRDRLILKLIVATGGRVSEILGLKIGDLDGERYEYIKVKGKGSKNRIIPVYKEIAEEIRFYIENVRKEIVIDSEADKDKEYLVFGGVSRTLFWRSVKTHAKNAGIEKNVYPHIFRHSIATEMLRNGANLRVVQEMLGHSSISTTEIYTHLSKRDLKKAYLESGIGDD
jgi:integrase/recombinase XerD